METIQITQTQIDLLASIGIVRTACICFCIGWLCHEFGAK